MTLSRQDICKATSTKLTAAAVQLPSIKAVIGLDGFVDSIIDVVDQRQDATHYDAIGTIDRFGNKIVAAAGQSSNYELVVKMTKFGGNGPIMAHALACAGLEMTYIGSVGYPTIHPVFAEFAKQATLIGLGEPGYTDALEFTDGKLMLGKITHLAEINWQNLASRFGIDRFTSLLAGADFIAMNNWTMLPLMGDIWKHMLDEVLPKLPTRPRGRGRKFFIDLADPEKRPKAELAESLRVLGECQRYVDVILGLNLKESTQVAQALGLTIEGDPEVAIETTAATIRETLGLACVVIHPRKGAAAADASGTARFAGPFVQKPKIGTGAGDHFNAGFALGQILSLSLAESLCAGVATSGYYVRTAKSPSATELAAFIAQLPSPE